ncbi:Haloacid dehalogenase-like hydrolase [Planctomycetales bacterium 10988]|nr:Haloacid dehalogenase-like hydrolase [Planctomycetales bacterium 10988]
MPPKFIYFDLGNVLLFFDHALMCRQIGEQFGVSEEAIRQFLFNAEDPVELRFEAGKVKAQSLYRTMCERFGKKPPFENVAEAAGDIFELNPSILPILGHLTLAGYRLGLLSNTNELHWQWICKHQYSLIPSVFEVCILSYEAGSIKPAAEIFHLASETAKVPPEDIFYIDDIAGHVEGAKAIGIDAVQYRNTPQLVEEIRKRGIRMSY